MSIPDKIKKLIETFDYNLDMYKKGSYNETQVDGLKAEDC